MVDRPLAESLDNCFDDIVTPRPFHPGFDALGIQVPHDGTDRRALFL